MAKQKGIISYGTLNSEEWSYFVDFDGWHEDSGTPLKLKSEINKEIKALIKEHSALYKLTIKREQSIL